MELTKKMGWNALLVERVFCPLAMSHGVINNNVKHFSRIDVKDNVDDNEVVSRAVCGIEIVRSEAVHLVFAT